MATEAEKRAAKAFNRTDPRLDQRGPGERLFEATPREEREGKTGSDGEGGKPGKPLPLPVRTGGRATLVERDNPNEFLEFHWDPTSYKITKKAKWTDDDVEGGTDITSYSGCSATLISFEMFLNDIGQPHKTQRSVEDSVEWLYNRLRPRNEAAVNRRVADGTRNRRWISQRDPTAGKPPPILVLYGLRDGFECVMMSCEMTTIFQAPPLGGEFGAVFGNATAQTGIDRNLGFNLGGPAFPDNQSKAEHARGVGGKSIVRASVSITLKEYVNAPGPDPGT